MGFPIVVARLILFPQETIKCYDCDGVPTGFKMFPMDTVKVYISLGSYWCDKVYIVSLGSDKKYDNDYSPLRVILFNGKQ